MEGGQAAGPVPMMLWCRGRRGGGGERGGEGWLWWTGPRVRWGLGHRWGLKSQGSQPWSFLWVWPSPITSWDNLPVHHGIGTLPTNRMIFTTEDITFLSYFPVGTSNEDFSRIFCNFLNFQTFIFSGYLLSMPSVIVRNSSTPVCATFHNLYHDVTITFTLRALRRDTTHTQQELFRRGRCTLLYLIKSVLDVEVVILTGVRCLQKCLFGCNWLIQSQLTALGDR